MRNFSAAKCTECGLTPQYHSIKSKSFEKTHTGVRETNKPPHGFVAGMLR